MYMYMYVYVYVYYVLVHVYLYVYVYIYTHIMYIRKHACMHACMYVQHSRLLSAKSRRQMIQISQAGNQRPSSSNFDPK